MFFVDVMGYAFDYATCLYFVYDFYITACCVFTRTFSDASVFLSAGILRLLHFNESGNLKFWESCLLFTYLVLT